MVSQRIVLGDCLDVFANERNVPAFVSDPPGLVGYSGFMGRKWDTAHESFGTFAPMLPTRNKQHARELEHDYNFTKYWAIRYAMAYDIADQHATMILWTLPRTSHLTANALRAAGWTIKDWALHLFGTGWNKSTRDGPNGERVPAALAPGYEGWLIATKGKPDLDIDACRVPRGGEEIRTHTGGQGSTISHNGFANAKPTERHTNGSLPKNALLSHCEECVRVGVKRVHSGGGTAGPMHEESHSNGTVYGTGMTQSRTVQRCHDGTGYKSVPAWHCLAGCVCGARSKWDPEKPLPTCPCGEVWRWLCAVAEVNGQSGNSKSPPTGNVITSGSRMGYGGGRELQMMNGHGDSGGAARFFNTFSYLSKCSSSERHAGCESLFWRANKKNQFGFDQVTKEEWEALAHDTRPNSVKSGITADHGPRDNTRAQGNVHPTAKSYRLMHWLHSITGAKRILDLTAGSGTGMYTAFLNGIEWLGAEVCPEAVTIAQARYAYWRSLSLSALHAIMTEQDTAKAIRLHSRYEPIAAE